MNLITIGKIRSIIFALALLALGIVFIIAPVASYYTVVAILSWVAVGLGALMIIQYFIQIKLAPTVILCSGLALLLAGTLTLLFPELVMYMIFIAICFIGFQYIASSFELKKEGEQGWWTELIYGIIQLILGVALFIVSYQLAERIVMISMGVVLILEAIFIVAMMCMIKRGVKQIKKEIKQ